jgi:DNA-binding XRE family transcriptional regulator
MGEVIAFPRPDRPAAERPEPRWQPEPLWREVLGHELRAERRSAGRTLSDVAEQAGVSTQYLSEVERGRKEPSSEVIGAVAGALGLRLVDLTGRVTRAIGRISGPVCLAA